METKSKWLAHLAVDEKGNVLREQTVLEHLNGTAERCAAFAAAFDAEDEGRKVGMLHDIGKYTDAFQKRLQGGAIVDHATAGAFEAAKTNDIPAAFCISGHHGGLPDGGGRADIDKSTLHGRLNKAKKGMLELYGAWRDEIAVLPKAELPSYCARDKQKAAFFIRMLYSCLVDADYLDTEQFMQGQEPPRGGGSTIDELNQRLDAYTSGWFPPEGELNTCRCDILRQCERRGTEEKPGLFTLTVPTGGGKTVASLAFALRHARANGLRRMIYVIPYTSIIEQTADVFRKILGEENVLEHHSGVLFDMDDEANEKNVRLMHASENWDMPVIVTTAVQFFESVYACKPSRCRKLHNLAQSVIVFDEAQMLPLPYLQPCVSAISQLVAQYHVSAVLCTATQPALEPLFARFLPDRPALELCPAGMYENPVFRRVAFETVGQLTWDALAEQLGQHRQVLCIVNSRKNAQRVYEQIDPEGAFHLSTLMYPAHRRAILREIRRRLDPKHPQVCRVVSTPLIEAGVDVDFPFVYRETAGLDSVLQAAGRCNREGRRAAEESIVTIFRPETVPPVLFAASVAAGEIAMEENEDIAGKAAIAQYFREWRDLKGEKEQDKKEILTLLDTGAFPFQTIAERFHLIETDTCTIYIPRGKGRELTEQLKSGEWSANLFRELGQYSVSVYQNHAQALYDAGDIEPVEQLKDTYMLTNPDAYSEETGLSMRAESGRAIFL